jgi:hypothetical protein
MMIDDIKRPDGALFAFDVRSGYTTYRGLCRFLARYPGVRFKVKPRSLIGTHPARFEFKGKEFEVCVPFSDYWVGPADPTMTFAEIEELRAYVEAKLLRPWRRRVIDFMTLDFRSAFGKR